MSDEELTIEDLGAQIKYLIAKEVLGGYKGKWHIHKLKTIGFGLRVNITLIEEEDTLYYVIGRKPIYRRPKVIAVSNGFTIFDFDFFQKERIFPPHEPPIAIKQPEEDCLLSQINAMITEALDGKIGSHYQLVLKKYGVGLRVNISTIQEDSPQYIIEEKLIKFRTKKPDSGFTADDLGFLGQNRLIGF